MFLVSFVSVLVILLIIRVAWYAYFNFFDYATVCTTVELYTAVEWILLLPSKAAAVLIPLVHLWGLVLCKNQGERTLIASAPLSSPGPLILGVALFSVAHTQLADFVRRSWN